MKENIKIGLLAIIAVTLIVDTFMGGSSPSNVEIAKAATTNTAPVKPVSLDAQPPVVEQPTGPTTNIQYAEELFDFGTVNQDSENTHIFKFTNTGSEPLLITNARGSCGCTVPEFPREPIMPGAEGEIKVVYKPGKQKGAQNKYVTVTANTNPADTRIQISADVKEVE